MSSGRLCASRATNFPMPTAPNRLHDASDWAMSVMAYRQCNCRQTRRTRIRVTVVVEVMVMMMVMTKMMTMMMTTMMIMVMIKYHRFIWHLQLAVVRVELHDGHERTTEEKRSC
jgi:hypothetical protein